MSFKLPIVHEPMMLFPAMAEVTFEDRFVEAFLRAPSRWEPVTGHDYNPDFEYVRHIDSGVTIIRPDSEGNPVMSNAMQSTYPGLGPISPMVPAQFGLSAHYPSQIKLGERYRDQQTGFEGTATSIHFYQHACERVSLESYNRKLGLEEFTFDAKRLVHIDSGEEVDSPIPGGPARADGKRTNPSR